MFKNVKIAVISLVLVIFGMQGLAMAQGTILPQASSSASGPFSCESLIKAFNSSGNFATPETKANTLGCAITTGRISLAMIPYFIQYLSNYLLGMVSLIALLFTVMGGVFYISSGLTENKDKGKTYIKNALFGMGIAFLAWTIVNVIISAITG